MVEVKIGRLSGPCTDKEAVLYYETAEHVGIVKDTLAAVNAASNGEERWYVIVDDGDTIIPR